MTPPQRRESLAVMAVGLWMHDVKNRYMELKEFSHRTGRDFPAEADKVYQEVIMLIEKRFDELFDAAANAVNEPE